MNYIRNSIFVIVLLRNSVYSTDLFEQTYVLPDATQNFDNVDLSNTDLEGYKQKEGMLLVC